MQESNKQSIRELNIREARRLRTLIILLLSYCCVGLILVFLFFPYIQDLLFDYLHYANAQDKLNFFVVIFLVTIFLCTSLFILFLRYKELTKELSRTSSRITTDENSDLPLNDAIYYGKYSAERQYLEEKMNEITHRLTETEEKWARVNQLIVSGSSDSRLPSSHLSTDAFLKDFGISLDEIQVERRSVFMLTPTANKFDYDYETVADVCRSCGIRITRGDEEDINYGSKNMLGHIVRSILSAGIIIANVSNRNPNVFYELGLAHMIGKPTILICARDREVPFDILQRYIIFYSSPSELADKLRTELLRIYING